MVKILKLLNPQPQIAGLEITDAYLRYLEIKFGQPKTYSVKLERGIIIEGRLQKKEEFLKALLALRNQITEKPRKKLFVVLNISPHNVYSQIFDLPAVAENNLEEAARLNLSMISPIDISEAYYDCQKIGENREENKIEIAAAFVNRNIIDDFSEVFLKAHFVIVAVEFVPLAIARAVAELDLNFDKKAGYIVFYLNSDGLNFLVIRNSNLYFNYFTSWRSLTGEKRYISFEEFNSIVIDETKKILSFYNRNWSDSIKSFIIIAHSLNAITKEILDKNFSLEFREITLRKFTQLSSIWLSSLGSALRGLIDRSEDNIISLTSIGTEEEFRRQIFGSFVRLWQKIIFSFLALIMIVCGGADFFLLQRVAALNFKNKDMNIARGHEEFNQLQNEFRRFNQKVMLLAKARQETFSWSNFFSKIKNIADQENIEIVRIKIESGQKNVYLYARATNEKKAADFKKVLANDPQFQDVDMPLAAIQPTSFNLIDFYITFKIR